MRLYMVVVDNVTLPIRARNASDAIWLAIEQYTIAHNQPPESSPYAIGYYTRGNKYVPLIDGTRKENEQ